MLKTLDKRKGIAKPLQLRNILLELIGSQYSAGQRFHSERELMNMFNVSSLTVSQAMKSLANDGIVERKVGGGTFIKKAGEEVLFMSGYTAPFSLYVNILPCRSLAESNPLNWFVTSEIQRGIINSFNGKIKMLSASEILSGLKNDKDSGCILINPPAREEETFSALAARLVNIDVDSRLKPAANCIRWECMNGIYDLFFYLVQQCGHRKIALIAGNPAPHKKRITGFRMNCETFNTYCPPEYIKLIDTGTREAGGNALRELLQLGSDRPTAVFVDTDIKAEGAVQAAQEAGLKVPDDISIAGFDDIPDAKHLCPSLTTIRVPYYEMGVQAVKKLMFGQNKAQCIPMQAELIVRASTGKVPADSR
ncbi:MAG: GntR family transcriptional regulator [Victivallales bacterium]